MKATYKVAMAAGQDAGNRSMRAAGRVAWNEDDWNVAADVTARLMPQPTAGVFTSLVESFNAWAA